MTTVNTRKRRGRKRYSIPRASIRTRLSAGERGLIQSKADAAGMTLSAFIRRAALGRQVRASIPPINLTAWSELSRLAGHLHQFLQLAHAGRLKDLYSVKADVSRLREAVDALRLALIDDGSEIEDAAA